MPSGGRTLVIGGGISAGAPFTLDEFLYVQSVTNPTAASYPGMRRGTNAIELPGTQAPNNRRNNVIGGNSINALATDAIVIGWNNTAGTASSPVTAHIVIGSAITGVNSTAMIAIGGTIADGGSASTIKIGSGMAGLHNDAVGIGFAVTLGGAANGVIIGRGAGTSVGGSGTTVVGNGSSGQTNVSIFGQGSSGFVQNCSIVGGGCVITGGGGSNIVLVGSQSGGLTVSNAIVLGHGASIQAGVISIGNTNLGALGYSTSVLWGGQDTHVSGTPVPAWTFRHKGAAGTDIAAGDVAWHAPRATGNAASGSIVFATGVVGATGTATQALADVFRITSLQKAEVMLDNGLTFVNQTDGVGAGAGTLTNAPTAGDPAFWLRVVINGTNHFIPAWT